MACAAPYLILIFVQGNIKVRTVVESPSLVAYKLFLCICIFRFHVGKKRLITMQSWNLDLVQTNIDIGVKQLNLFD